jgi:hypothetical protein
MALETPTTMRYRITAVIVFKVILGTQRSSNAAEIQTIIDPFHLIINQKKKKKKKTLESTV